MVDHQWCFKSRSTSTERESMSKSSNNTVPTRRRLDEDGDYTTAHSNAGNRHVYSQQLAADSKQTTVKYRSSYFELSGIRMPPYGEYVQPTNDIDNSHTPPTQHSPPATSSPPTEPSPLATPAHLSPLSTAASSLSTVSSRSVSDPPNSEVALSPAYNDSRKSDDDSMVNADLSKQFNTVLSCNHDDQPRPGFDGLRLQNDDGDTVLHVCIIHETPDMDFILRFIDACLSPKYLDITNVRGQTALHLAIIVDLPRVVFRLLAAGASADECENRNGDNAPLLACRLGRGHCFKAIIEALNYRVAMVSTSPKLAKALQTTDLKGQSCLHLASKLQNKEIFYYLLLDGCPIDVNVQEGRRGATVLHQAAERNDVEVIEALMQSPFIDASIETYDGYTALQMSPPNSRARTILSVDTAQPSECPRSASSADEMETE